MTFRKLFPKEPFSPAERDIILGHRLHDHGTKMLVHAAVVMPEHVHILLSALHDTNSETFSLIELLQSLKGASAHMLNKFSHRSGPVWQDESFDHVLRNEESLAQKIEYIRQNPIRRGLAKNPEQYPWLWINPAESVAAA